MPAIDIVHNMTFNVQDASLNALSQRLKQLTDQADSISKRIGSIGKGADTSALQKQLDAAFNKIGQLIDKNRQLAQQLQDQASRTAKLVQLESQREATARKIVIGEEQVQQSVSRSATLAANREAAEIRLQNLKAKTSAQTDTELSEESGLLARLQEQMDMLITQRARFTDPGQFAALNKQLFQVQSQYAQLTSTTSRSVAGITGLQFAGSQILREAPAFLYSVQTGILALSNNIPILLDELDRVRAAGGGTTEIINQLGKAFFSTTGLITIAVSVLTFIIPALTKTDEAVQSVIDRLDELNKSLNAIPKDVQIKIGVQQAQAGTLLDVIKSGGIGNSSEKAFDDLKELIPAAGNYTLKQIQSSKDIQEQLLHQIALYERANGSMKTLQQTTEQVAQDNNLIGLGFNRSLNAIQRTALFLKDDRAPFLSSLVSDLTGLTGKTDDWNKAVKNVKDSQQTLKGLQQDAALDYNLANQNFIEKEDKKNKKLQEQKILLSEILENIRQIIEETNRIQYSDILSSDEVSRRNSFDEQTQTEEVNKRILQAQKENNYTLAIQEAFEREKQAIRIKYAALEVRDRTLNDQKLLKMQQDFDASLLESIKKINDENIAQARQNNEDTTDLLLSGADIAAQQESSQLEKTFQEQITNLQNQQKDLQKQISLGDKDAQQLLEQSELDEINLRSKYDEQVLQLEQKNANAIVTAYEQALKDREDVLKQGLEVTKSNLDAQSAIFSVYLSAIRKNGVYSFAQYNQQLNKSQDDTFRQQLNNDIAYYTQIEKERQAHLDKLLSMQNVSDKDLQEAQEAVSQSQIQRSNSETQRNNLAPATSQRSSASVFLFGDTKAGETSLQLQQREQDEISKTIDYFIQLGNIGQEAYDKINKAAEDSLDREIAIREDRVAQAEKLAERGNTSLLKSETDRLEQAQQKREEIAQRQRAVDGAAAASAAALAGVQSILAITNAASQGDGYTAALRVGLVVAAMASAFGIITSLVSGFSSQAESGFADGGYTGDGGKYQEAGKVHKSEFVFTKERTKQFRPLFEYIHRTGELPQMAPKDYNQSEKTDYKNLEEKLDRVTDAIYDTQVKVSQKIDKNGVAQAVESYIQKDRRRWN